jgi:hypothetical protein
MILKKSFDDFLAKINLDPTRREKIQSAHNTVRGILEQDEEVKKIYLETFLQGSYRLGTAVRPQGAGSYDVDVILSLNLMDFEGKGCGLPSSKMVIDWLAARLSAYPAYKDKVTVGERCVTLVYAAGFYLDIVPAHDSTDLNAPLLVPPKWSASHPKGFKEHCLSVQQSTGEMFYPVVKMLKWWRNIHFGDDGCPKSILLTTLIGQHIPKSAQSVDEALVLTMESLNTFFGSSILVPAVFNPSLPTENLSGRWPSLEYLEFKPKFAAATKRARKAFDAKDEEKTIEEWNTADLFDDTFPKALYGLEEEAKNLANAMRAGTLFTSPGGLLSPLPSSGSIGVPATKFFGQR